MKKILVAEDDNFLANAYRLKLTKAEFEVKLVTDGEEALQTLQTFTPDLIILDDIDVDKSVNNIENIEKNYLWIKGELLG